MTLTAAITFTAPARWHVGYALLGRWVRRRVGDAWRAEGWLLVGLIGLGVALVVLHFWSRAAWGSAPAAWLVPLAADGVAGLLALAGVQPGVRVVVEARRLVLRQGRTERVIPFADLRAAEPIAVLAYHRGLRRDPAVPLFATRLPATVLLLHTKAGTVALGLPDDQQDAFLKTLAARRADVAARAAA